MEDIKLREIKPEGQIFRLDIVRQCHNCLQDYHPTQSELDCNYRPLCSGSCVRQRYGY